MTICHSFWIKPCKEGRWNVEFKYQLYTNLYCFMMSCLWAQKHGCRVAFYGDKESIKLFSLIPYDDMIEIELPADAFTTCWAQGKFYAYQKMNLGDIHIDGDVFMRGDELYKRLENDYDCIIQSKEDDKDVYRAYTGIRNLYKDVKWDDGCTSLPSPAYNVGVCGFKNQKLKDLYIKHYFDSIEKIRNIKIPEGSRVVPDLLLEQQHLYEIVQNNGYKASLLIGDETGLADKTHDEAIRLGYQHLLGSRKYREIQLIRNDLMHLDPQRCKQLDEYTDSH